MEKKIYTRILLFTIFQLAIVNLPAQSGIDGSLNEKEKVIINDMSGSTEIFDRKAQLASPLSNIEDIMDIEPLSNQYPCQCRPINHYGFEYPSTGNGQNFLPTPLTIGRWYSNQFVLLASQLGTGNNIHLWFPVQACYSQVSTSCYGHYEAKNVGTGNVFSSFGTTADDHIQIPVSALGSGLNTFEIKGTGGSTVCSLKTLEINVVGAFPPRFTAPSIDCYFDMSMHQGKGKIRFSCERGFPNDGYSVKISKNGTLVALIPWTTSDFVSPPLNVEHYDIEIVDMNGSHGFTSTIPLYSFPYQNAHVAPPTHCNCCAIQTQEINFDKQQSIVPKNFLSEGFTIFPNPATDQLTILFTQETKLPIEVEVYDILGILHTTKVLNSSSTSIQLEVSSLPIGTYALRLKNSSLASEVKTIHFSKQ